MPVPEHSIHYLEIVTPDVEAACHLYGTAYRWRFQATGPELGNSFLATLPGGGLCGVRAPMSDQETPIPGHGKIAIYLHGGVEQGLWQVP